MDINPIIAAELQHVNTLHSQGKPILTKVLSRLFLMPVYFRVQALAISPEEVADVEMYGKLKGRKCPESLLASFRGAVLSTGHSVRCLGDFKGDLVDQFKGETDQDKIRAGLISYIHSDKGADVRRILGFN